ncbi:MAG TPA: alpha/beta fold hydrolase [Acidimicrobiales bacterium]|nr:alpha/beta fold hydrolase [Acidimicrobiales bacterium]
MVDVRGVLGRVDPLGLAGALAQVGARTATGALPGRALGLGVELAKIAVGRSSVAPDPKDWRFKNRAWSENPAFHRLCQGYLAWSRSVIDLVDEADLDWRTEQRAKLGAGLLTSALAPTNLPLLNPDSVERAYETGGRSVVKGIGNVSRDVRTNRGFPRSVDSGAFVVGRDLAVTSGAVVFRNEVCELIQYAPATDTVGSIPLVMIPPQINKYYFMDLSPGRSYVEFCVRQGFQMFAVSWRNPTEEHREWGIDAYVDAVHEAVAAACQIAGADRANTVSLCAGGITTAAMLGYLAATGDPLVNCATFAVTLLDFSVPTMIGLFGTPEIIRNALRASRRGGVLRSGDTTALFSMLRPNDLIWNYWVRNNLMGEDPPAFDILAWNADSTRLPAALHADFLDMFLQNSLASGKFSVHGEPIDLGKVDCDSFVVAARTDHLTDWKACYATTQLLGGTSQFALSSSGHIQSLVNPPGNPKMSVATAPASASDPDRWLADAEPVPGSWWEPWSAWAGARSGARRPASTSLGSVRHPVVEPAPGRYVLAR